MITIAVIIKKSVKEVDDMIEFICCYNVIMMSLMRVQLTNIRRGLKEYQYFSIGMIKKNREMALSTLEVFALSTRGGLEIQHNMKCVFFFESLVF